MSEQYTSLRQAARLAGIGPKALKRWLEKDLGIRFPRVGRGSRIIVRQKDVDYVLALRSDARNILKMKAPK